MLLQLLLRLYLPTSALLLLLCADILLLVLLCGLVQGFQQQCQLSRWLQHVVWLLLLLVWLHFLPLNITGPKMLLVLLAIPPCVVRLFLHWWCCCTVLVPCGGRCGAVHQAGSSSSCSSSLAGCSKGGKLTSFSFNLILFTGGSCMLNALSLLQVLLLLLTLLLALLLTLLLLRVALLLLLL
jgi:hypothetical protein